MSEAKDRLVRVVKRRYEAGADLAVLGYVEETYEPLDGGPDKYAGFDRTLSLPHGQAPDPAAGWEIHELYAKEAVWKHHREVGA